MDLSVDTKPVINSSELSPSQRLILLLRLQRYALRLWDKLLVRLLSTQAIAFLNVLLVLVAARVVDDALGQQDMGALLWYVSAAVALTALVAALGWIGGVVGFAISAEIMVTLRLEFYRHLQRLSTKLYEARPIGEHAFRCAQDVDDAAFLASETIPLILSAVLRAVTTSVVLHSFSGWVFPACGIYLVVFLTVKHCLASVIRKWDRDFRVQSQALEAILREVLASFRLVKGYARERTVSRWYLTQASRVMTSLFKRDLFTVYDTWFNVASFFFVLAVNLVVGLRVTEGSMTLGDYTAIGGLASLLVLPFQEIIAAAQTVRQRLVPAERMLETLDIAPEVVDPPDQKALVATGGRVAVDGVHFAYEEGNEVLKGVSFEAMPGQKTAIVGPIGAGKSTLLKLLVRLYDPCEGRVLVDGVNIRSVTLASLRRHVGIVTQDVVTLTESLGDNIRYGAPDASDDAVRWAGRLAGVEAFASALPEGYDTELSETGSLSGGQKQRVCLARTLVGKPRILLLDEATSSLDPVTEKHVMDSIDEAFAGATRIVVTHSLFCASTADRVHVLVGGRIVESGTHSELIERAGPYTRLWTARNRRDGSNEHG